MLTRLPRPHRVPAELVVAFLEDRIVARCRPIAAAASVTGCSRGRSSIHDRFAAHRGIAWAAEIYRQHRGASAAMAVVT